MQVEWEVTLKCNYKCRYCTNLDQTLNVVEDKEQLRSFIRSIGVLYPRTEIFVFGGEPFLHPEIEHIINCLNEYEIPFVIQTNFSKKSVAVMRRIQSPFKIQISIHPTEVKLNQLPALFQTKADIRTVDVMYTGKEAIPYFFKVRDLVNEDTNVFLTPVTDFGDGVSNISLIEYNRLRKNPAYAKFIRFEQVQHFGKDRSELWIDPEFSPKGKPCLYNGKYFLYGPNLQLYTCCYRELHNGTCNHNKCFLM